MEFKGGHLGAIGLPIFGTLAEVNPGEVAMLRSKRLWSVMGVAFCFGMTAALAWARHVYVTQVLGG